MTAVTTDVLVVGAGFFGLSSAWWMKQRRSGARIMVVDEGEFASGASGRNGAGFRMQWGLDLNILLSKESTAFFENAAELLDYPRGIELKQDGYLVLAHSQNALDRLNASIAIQHRYQVPSELLDVDACMKMVPALNREAPRRRHVLRQGRHCVAFPFARCAPDRLSPRRGRSSLRHSGRANREAQRRVHRIDQRRNDRSEPGASLYRLGRAPIAGAPGCQAARDELAEGGYRHGALHARG